MMCEALFIFRKGKSLRESSTSPIGIGRRPEVEDGVRAIEIPFARHVDFGQHVDRIEGLAFAVAVGGKRRSQGNFLFRRINRGDPLVGIGPAPEPIAVEPGVVFFSQRSGRWPSY